MVAEPAYFIPGLRKTATSSGLLLVGFDFPIGLPMRYAEETGVDHFPTQMLKFGEGEWSEFYLVAERREQISLKRPFYPMRPGNALRSHLVNGLGMNNFDDLRRICERAYPNRRAAAPLFWTLGGQQVGKAAITGWRDVVIPEISRVSVNKLNNRPSLKTSLWPFEGCFFDLMEPASTIIVETYPGEFYHHLEIDLHPRSNMSPELNAGRVISSPRGGKRSQDSRASNADKLLTWAENAGVVVSTHLKRVIYRGFGPGVAGEDQFDATIGLFGMLNVLLGMRPPGDPLPEQPYYQEIHNVEGWILGQGHCIMNSSR